ncbi:MAG: hypothetical protein VXZ82_05110 [Planctomycetota bacterium]|nr:hypothetical protein [Planctomycetota bacterium]
MTESKSEPPIIDPPIVSQPQSDKSASAHLVVVMKEPQRAPIASTAAEGASQPITVTDSRANEKIEWYMRPIWLFGRTWDYISLAVLVAVVAAIPIVQLASLGYLLVSAANLAERRPWRDCIPGLRLAGKLGTFALLGAIAWLPVWLVTDLAYSVQLLQPGSGSAGLWRIAAFLATGAWITHLAWAAIRGGRWWHVLWPAPIRFLREIWNSKTWTRASDELYELVASVHFPRLWWLGARAGAGVLIWVCIPVTMMIIGQHSQDVPTPGLFGFLGAFGMTAIMLYLPFLQIQMAAENRFLAIFDFFQVRQRFLYGPLWHSFAMLSLVILCVPLYLLRIEPIPAELAWAPAFVFVLFMLPAKILIGAAMGYANGRQQAGQSPRSFLLRWPARLVSLASVLIYVGFLYLAQLVAPSGLIMYFQHALLVPAPLI